MKSFSAALVAASYIASVFAAGPTGNERYAFTRSISNKKSGLRTRSASNSLNIPAQSSVDFELDGISYVSPFDSDLSIHTLKVSDQSTAPDHTGFPVPFTVVGLNDTASCEGIQSLIESYKTIDDVWTPSFLQGIYIQSSTDDQNIKECLTQNWNSSLIFTSSESSGDGVYSVTSGDVPPGPYLANINNKNEVTLSPVYRVYTDDHQAFTSSALRTNDGTFRTLPGAHDTMNTLGITVPSRLYFHGVSSPDKPLLGKRVAIKDIYDVAGLKTGCGNRAYFELYEAASENSFPVQRLVDAGAIIIGKVKTSQFANGESPTADWVDQMCPYNPRGDGYMDPSSSSSGSGAAIGAYDWLDYTIGSDTGGSVRDPAAVQGAYGIRPSHGAIDLTNVMAMAPVLDTAGFFARDPDSFKTFGKAWYTDFKSYNDFPKTLYIPEKVTNETSANPEAAQKIYQDFYDDLAKFLNATTNSTQLDSIWNSTMLDKVDGKSLQDYTYSTYGMLISYYEYHNLRAPFFKDYQEQYDGRSPFISPSPKARWDWAANKTEDDYNQAIEQKETFKTFFQDNVVKTNEQSCSDAIYLRTISAGQTTYRNLYGDAPGPSVGYFDGVISPFAETPEIVIPIGQIPYQSDITQIEEYLPVSVSLIAQHGCDYMLFDLAVALKSAGIVGSVKAGRTPF